MEELFTKEQIDQLKSNGSPEHYDQDHAPVVMLTLPFTNCVWLLSEINPEQPDIAFGLCDLGMGYPELGYVSIYELLGLEDPVLGMRVCNNTLFKGEYPMSAYANAARAAEQIVWDKAIVGKYVQKKSKGLRQ